MARTAAGDRYATGLWPVWGAEERIWLEENVVKRRILIADDEARVLLILHDSLKKLGNGYEITIAHDGVTSS